jgi:heat shock protein HslJ
VLTSEATRVHGFSQCKHSVGSRKRNGSQLRFSTLATTRKACVEGMEQEQRFLKALGEMARFTLSGERLAFYTGDERLILRFKAIALK